MTSPYPYAEVIGDPVAHSKSPIIHGFWLEKLGLPGRYDAVRVQAGDVARYLSARLHDERWRGCNVTMPLKREALEAAGHHRVGRAEEVGAANLLLPTGGGEVRADNSDVIAVETLLRPHFSRHPEVVVHLIGSGGAAAAAAAAVKRLGPPVSVFTYARDEERAFHFRERVGLEASLSFCHRLGDTIPWGSAADVVINATPLGMRGHDPLHFPLHDFEAGATLFDVVYDPLETPLLREGQERGMNVIDGLQMLVEQAAHSFACFFGKNAPREHDSELRRLLTA